MFKSDIAGLTRTGNAAAFDWAMEILASPPKLGVYIGKYAAEMWLYDEPRWKSIGNAFRLTLKYYCKSHRQQLDDIHSLQELAADDFASILKHFGNPNRVVKPVNF